MSIELLRQEADNLGISLTAAQTEQFRTYQSFLLEYNEKVNLTAITDPAEIAIKHFADSLLVLKTGLVQPGASIIDVGTGAGFPLVPVCIARPDVKPCLLDSLQKRVTFLEQLTEKLGIEAKVVHARAEDAGRDPAFRERYDLATARAVARLRELAEYCLPFVKPGGAFLALKGFEIEEELEEAKPAIRALGGQIDAVLKFELRDNRRSIVVIKKISQTSAKYPRIPAKIKKDPIKARTSW